VASRHVGWQPHRLRAWRLSYGLALEAVGEQLRLVASDNGLGQLAANFQSIWRHEQGEVYPGPTYRRAYCLLFNANEAELGFRPPLPGEPVPASPLSDGADQLRRRDFLRTAAVAGGAVAIAAALRDQVSEQECLQALALEMCRAGTNLVHRSDLPADVAEYFHRARQTADSGQHSLLRVDRAGNWSFAHHSLIDFFAAQAMSSDIQRARTDRLCSVQTSHETDRVIKDFITQDRTKVPALRGWLYDSPDPVLRVNSAGILAKMDDPIVGDDVIRAIQSDTDARRRYLTAVLARTVGLQWREAADLATQLDQSDTVPASDPFARVALRLATELHNPRDTAARWCSALVLGRVRDAAPQHVIESLHAALPTEDSRETRQAIDHALRTKGNRRC
jgi:hypothetical protein